MKRKAIEEYKHMESIRTYSVELVEHIATINTYPDGVTTLELNRISFNGGVPRYDLRIWDIEKNKMKKGINLSEYEVRKLKDVLNSIFENKERKNEKC